MNNSRTYYYARVSSEEQNLDRQLEAFRTLGASDDEIITDKASGKDLERDGYKLLKRMLRPGDTLVIKSLDRLSRAKEDIKEELAYYKKNGVRVKIIDLPATMTDFPEGQEMFADMVFNILIEVYSTFAEEERKNIKKRQAEGIAAAHNKGTKFGRPTAERPASWYNVVTLWQNGTITGTKAIEMTGLKRTTFYKLFNEDKAKGLV